MATLSPDFWLAHLFPVNHVCSIPFPFVFMGFACSVFLPWVLVSCLLNQGCRFRRAVFSSSCCCFSATCSAVPVQLNVLLHIELDQGIDLD